MRSRLYRRCASKFVQTLSGELKAGGEDVRTLADAEPQMMLIAERRARREHDAVLEGEFVGERERRDWQIVFQQRQQAAPGRRP